MNYFISENVFALNSGTEHAQARRVKVFAGIDGEPAVYVTRAYNRFLDRDRQTLDLKPSQVLSMYDYFQGTTAVKRREQPLRGLSQIPLDTYTVDGHGPNYATLAENGEVVARANIMPGTVGLVGDIDYQDRFGNPIARENFDWRGFKSSVDYFHPDGQLARTVYLNVTGEPVLTVVCMNRGGQVAPTLWQLHNFQGQNYRFASEDELFGFFLTQLVVNDPKARLFSDRRSLDPVVAAVAAPQKWAVFHDTHIRDGAVLSAYQPVLGPLAPQFTGVLVPTADQQAALAARFPQLRAIFVPDTALFAQDPTQQAAPRVSHRIAMVGRLAPEKGPVAALRIFTQVRASVPDATLVMRGYPISQDYLHSLQGLAEKLQIADAVTFAAYVTGPELSTTYAQAEVLLAPSVHEGLGMQLVEALAAGTPVVASDVDYGPRDVIVPGENGALFQPGDEAEAAAKLVKILTDATLWQALHTGAQQTAARYDCENAQQQWRAFLHANPLG